jgi:hypothetical protein
MRAASIVGVLLLCVAGCGTPHATSPGDDGGGNGAGGNGAGGNTDGGGGPPPGGGNTDGGGGPPSGGDIGPHEPMPIIPNQGGPTLSTLQLVTISFAADPNSAKAGAFGDFVVGSSWLATVGADYGLQSATHAKDVVLTQAAGATVSDTSIQTLIASKIQDGTVPSGAQVLFLIFYPPGTVVQSALDGADTCVSIGSSAIGGYHWESANGTPFPYAVVPTCANEALADIQASASHELLEAATDPFPMTKPAWVLTDPTNPWSALDGEVADFCELLTTTEGGYSLQQIWSNTAARANDRDPCIPSPPTPFYNATATPATAQMVPAGQSFTFEIKGWSSAPVAPWMLSADSFSGPLSGGASFDPKPMLDATTLQNGQSAHMTISVPAGTASGASALIFVTSSRSLTDFSSWPVVVTVP